MRIYLMYQTQIFSAKSRCNVYGDDDNNRETSSPNGKPNRWMFPSFYLTYTGPENGKKQHIKRIVTHLLIADGSGDGGDDYANTQSLGMSFGIALTGALACLAGLALAVACAMRQRMRPSHEENGENIALNEINAAASVAALVKICFNK